MSGRATIDLSSLDYQPAHFALQWAVGNARERGYSVPGNVSVALDLLDGRLEVATYSSAAREPWAILIGSKAITDEDFEDLLAVAKIMATQIKRRNKDLRREAVAADFGIPAALSQPIPGDGR